MSERWWAGGYTLDAGGSGDGIHLLASSPGEAMTDLGLATSAESPSFVATHPTLPVVYAVSELRGEVAAYAVSDAGALTMLENPWPAGALTCHLGVDPAGRFVIASCWGSGDVVLYRLDAEGRLMDRQVAEAAQDPHGPGSLTPGADPDPYTGQGRLSRAHTTRVLEDGRVVSTDLGYDLVRFWTYDDAHGLRLEHEVVLPADAGPRHLVQHPDGRVLVVTEYSCEVVALERSAGPGAPYVVTGSVVAVAPQAGDTAAEIALSPDGRHVYVGIRGSDLLATLAVGQGRLDPVAVTPSGGRSPRHHAVGPGVLHVVHEESDEVTTLELDPATGIPGRIVHRLALGSPTVLVRAR